MKNVEPPQKQASEFMMQAADLARDIEAMRKRLCEIAASGIDFAAVGQAASIEEKLRTAHTVLTRLSWDVAAGLRAGITQTTEDTTPDADNTNEQ